MGRGGTSNMTRSRRRKSIVHQLVDVVSKNGNLLLNIGPKSDGTIPDEVKQVLLAVGGG